MNEKPALSRAWIRAAVVYFAVGVVLGVGMGASGDHSLFPLHAHLNLLGWVSMALFGLIQAVYPAVAEGRLPKLQYWLHNGALPVLSVALGFELKGHHEAGPVLGIASALMGLSVLLFAWQVLVALRSEPTPAAARAQAHA